MGSRVQNPRDGSRGLNSQNVLAGVCQGGGLANISGVLACFGMGVVLFQVLWMVVVGTHFTFLLIGFRGTSNHLTATIQIVAPLPTSNQAMVDGRDPLHHR